MPIYEFVCKACGNQFEEILPFSDKPRAPCPACGSKEVDKQVSASAFHLKGGGWYVTDYKKSSGGSSAKSSSESDTSAATCGTCGGAPGSCSTDA